MPRRLLSWLRFGGARKARSEPPRAGRFCVLSLGSPVSPNVQTLTARAWVGGAICLLLVSCLPRTSYIQIQEDLFQVRAGGNVFVGSLDIDAEALHRAAEITLGHGFDHFVIIEKDHDTLQTTETSGDVNSRGRITISSSTSTRYATTYLFRVGNGEAPPGVLAYDAREILKFIQLETERISETPLPGEE